MKKLLKVLLYSFVLIPLSMEAQGFWVTYSQKISLKAYEGHRFRVQANIKTEIEDVIKKGCDTLAFGPVCMQVIEM